MIYLKKIMLCTYTVWLLAESVNTVVYFAYSTVQYTSVITILINSSHKAMNGEGTVGSP